MKQLLVSLDPVTNQPPADPLVGFLPPGAEASVLFAITPNQSVGTGTTTTNIASVVFDENPATQTPLWSNTIDNTSPVSHVKSLPATVFTPGFIVTWSGTDVGAGIQDFTIYVSDNGAPFTAWLTNTTATSATYTGQNGHTYGFYSIARDLVGNIEASKTVAEVTTNVVIDTTPPVITPTITGTKGHNGWYVSSVTVSWSVTDPLSGVASSTGCTTTTLSSNTTGVTLTCSATNGSGYSDSASVTVKIDQTSPVISGMPPAGCTLWPPNGKLVQVATISAGDSLSGLATFAVSGASSEPLDPGGPDIVITGSGLGPETVQLRAERLGTGTGRTYTIKATAGDNAGNIATKTGVCVVPHDQGNN